MTGRVYVYIVVDGDRPVLPLGIVTEGLGWEHAKQRRALLPFAYGKPCPLCGRVMLHTQRLQLDHQIPRAVGGLGGPVRIVHGVCNERAGGKLAQKLRRRAAKRRDLPPSWRGW
jgi:hypothetical protein